MTNPYVFGVRLDDGKCSLIGWSDTKLSTKQLRSVCSRFKNDSDVVGTVQLPYERFFDTKREMKKELQEFG